MSRQDEIVFFLKELREKIIATFETFEPVHRFERTPWKHHTGGGGEIALLRGNVFEKGAVNWSGVSGDQFPMQDGAGAYFATGISSITHMANPHAPTVHMNLRYIETEKKFWFGGGYDLTPMGPKYEEDRLHFHAVAEKTLGPLYIPFSQQAATYFYIPHRKKERGVGGIFFDHYNSGDFDADLAMWKKIGNTFLDAIIPIYRRRVDMAYTEKDIELQQLLRSHYVEFNLLYDRGTQFGFKSGGNPDAILCSLPPSAKW